MNFVQKTLTNLLCGDNMPSYPAKPTFQEDCVLHNVTTSYLCSGKDCNRSTCIECLRSPTGNFCIECAIKEMVPDVTALAIGAVVGLIYDIFFIAHVLQNGIAFQPLRLILYLLFELTICIFWYFGARKWAQIGHAERGFAQPEGLDYPLYGAWLFWHWFTRFVYYICFVSFPFFIGPFVGVPVLLKTIKKCKYIKQCCSDNK